MEVITREVDRSLWGCNHVDWLYWGLRWVSGGILVMWDRRVMKKNEECVGKFVVACYLDVLLRILKGHLRVYGPNDDVERRCLWNELVGMMI
jgi:hypothetical protein